ncbi:MAG: hypothetical protein AAFQ51_09605, partial [Pseudomonadota bacterium]
MADLSKDLLLSVLAADAYYQGITGRTPHGKTEIGPASLREGFAGEGTEEWLAASFSASTYRLTETVGDLTAGTYVISYRGTDEILGRNWKRFWEGDAWEGWLVGGGFVQKQAELAGEYYGTVLNALRAENGGEAPKIVLTGHSLGGGLAGLVGFLNQEETVIFDNMPFQLTGNRIYARASQTDEQIREDLAGFEDLIGAAIAERDLYLQRYYGWNGTDPRPVPAPPNLDSISGLHVPGEINQILRNLPGSFRPDDVGNASSEENIADIPSLNIPVISRLAKQGGALHPQSHLILRLFSDETDFSSTQSASDVWEPEFRKHLMKAIYDRGSAIPAAAGFEGYSDMLTAIAYSALGQD